MTPGSSRRSCLCGEVAQVVGGGDVAPVGLLLAPVDEQAVGPAGEGTVQVHAVAFAPRQALAGSFLDADLGSVERAFATSTYSYASLARLLATY